MPPILPPEISAAPARKPPIALTIAGFDPSSGAGITADLQVFAAHGLYGTACVTALTVQSTTGVAATESASALVRRTLDHLHDDLPPAGIKIGMLGDLASVAAVAAYLRERIGPGVPVVLDPVLVSSSGAALLTPDGLAGLQSELLPHVTWITPNIAELAILSGLPVEAAADIEAAMRALQARHPHLHIVATGGHRTRATDTLLTPTGKIFWFDGDRIETTSTHGTGCAFSSALLARLVLGDAPGPAVAAAKAYVAEALRTAPGLGHGRGPLNLLWPLKAVRPLKAV
jgi:hydroxymethylpyrimidine/phosphomethylpyrimidine kinase